MGEFCSIFFFLCERQLTNMLCLVIPGMEHSSQIGKQTMDAHGRVCRELFDFLLRIYQHFPGTFGKIGR